MTNELLQALTGPRDALGPPASPGRNRARRLLILSAIVIGLGLVARMSVDSVVPKLRNELFAVRVKKMREVLLAASRESGVDAYLLAGVMCSESSGHVDARSKVGALGLFQLMPATARERARILGLPEPSEEDLLSDAALNARLGANYLAWLLRRNDGNVERSLVAYNAGPGRSNRLIEAAGGWDDWVAEREAAGNSDLLAYVRKVLTLRDQLAARKLLE